MRGGGVETPLGRFAAPDLAEGSAAVVAIRPQGIALRPAGTGHRRAGSNRRRFLGEVELLSWRLTASRNR